MSGSQECGDAMPAERKRAAYEAPALTVYGNLAELTRHGPAKSRLDGNTGTAKTNS